MGDEYPICTLGGYSRPSHKGYRNTIELLDGNNVAPLRSDTIRTTKLRNDILVFQQHQGGSLSEAWTRFKDLLQKVPYHGIDLWLQIQIFYDHVSFHLKCEIDRAAGGKLRDKKVEVSLEITKNLALYDHKGWNDSRGFIKPVKAISFPPNTSKTPDRRLLELEEQIKFLLKGPQTTHGTSSTNIPQAYVKEVSSNPPPQSLNETSGQNSFTKRVNPNPQLKELEASFEARVRDYIATHTERIEREYEVGNKTNNEPTRNTKKYLTQENVRELVEAPRPRPVNFYLKHKINKDLIEGLVGNSIFNDSILAMQSDKMECEAYHSLPVEPMCKAMLKKMIPKKEDMRGMDALVEQGSDVNVMPLSTYNRLTNKNLVKTDIKLSLASQSHSQPLGISKDMLVEIARFIYPVDFVILDIKEDMRKPFILGTPFLTTAKAKIRFDKGTITLKYGKSKANFDKIPELLCKFKEREKDEFDLETPTSTINKLILE
uniref:MAK10-like protein n=1 Tax=Tanacetum cinerariifolium TaxID=118510 RepID=A0A6L2JHI3_TANCI|nr:hypothetical protein [Tanacetum cinerariifolium]